MFSAVRDFLHRHRRKFFFAGAAVGGFTLACKIAERKLIEWQDEQARKLVEQQKRKQHYDRTLETTRVTVLQLLPNIRKSIERELDSDTFIQAIKDQPEKKRELWQELKLVGFGRAVCTVVCTAVAAPVAHVMMMVLAANSLDTSSEGASGDKQLQNVLSLEVQTKYMSCLQNLIEEQMSDLITKIMDVTSNTLASLPLTRKLTLPQLESILQQITLSVTNNRQNSEFIHETPCSGSAVLPWSQYLKEPETSSIMPEYNDKLMNMHLLTVDIINTNDFNDVVGTLVQVGLNYVLDEMAGFYFNNQFITQKLINEGKPQADLTDQKKSLDAQSTSTDDCSPPSAEKNDSGTSMASKPQSPDDNSSSSCNSSDIATCVVVKLVPMLSGIVHKALPTARQLPGQHNADNSTAAFYNRLLVCSQLEALAYNVYDTLVLSSSVVEPA